MRRLRQVRWLFLALVLSLVPASSYAGVFISVGFAPPVMPVYVQPPCPQPGLMWTPGYWAYGEDGYYWVPGAWVPAPYVGALWTPPYWGWDSGLYMFHPGYWGPQVGYYGGVNYGFGYLGVGFVGGMWRGNDFYYNRAAWRVDDHRIHDYYEDRRDWDRHWVERDSHVSYSGGPGGIRHEPDQRERQAMRDAHIDRTSFQEQHQREAMNNRNAYARFNGGRPATVVANRPLQAEQHPAPQSFRQAPQNSYGNNRAGAQMNQGAQPRSMQQRGQGYQDWQRGNQGVQNQQMQRGNQAYQNGQMQRGNPGNQPSSYRQQGQGYQNREMQQANRPQPQFQQRNNQGFQNRQMQQPENRQQPQFQQRGNQGFQNRQMQQNRQPAPQNRPAPGGRDEGKPGQRGR